MKNILFIILLLTYNARATDIKNDFQSANQFYQSGKYEQAIKMYEATADNNKLESAELYFNLGNCYYKLHKVAPAIYNYEKAKQLAPDDTEIETNLDFARKMAIDDIKIIPKVGFGKILLDFTSSFNFDTWAWISIAFAALFFLFFVGYYFSATSFKKRSYFVGMIVMIIGVFIGLFSAYFEKSRLQNENPAIVFAEVIVVKSEPKNASQDAFTLHEGAKVQIIESVANWKKIQLTDETTGWIDEKALKSLRD